jgi:hypothetical protein
MDWIDTEQLQVRMAKRRMFPTQAVQVLVIGKETQKEAWSSGQGQGEQARSEQFCQRAVGGFGWKPDRHTLQVLRGRQDFATMDSVPEKALITPGRMAGPLGSIGKQVAHHRIVVERPSEHLTRLWDVGCREEYGTGVAAHGAALVSPQRP